jgi:hypothetical protein
MFLTKVLRISPIVLLDFSNCGDEGDGERGDEMYDGRYE